MSISPFELLVIDDCPEDRENLRDLLAQVSHRRFRIREAATAAEGVRAARAKVPDCILLDYRLPDFDGIAVLRQLGQDRMMYKCPIVFMTGSPERSASSAALNSGAHDVLSKTNLNAEVLERTIENATVRFTLTVDRDKALRALAEREGLLRLAQEAAGIGTFDLDLATQETSFAGAYFKLYGLPANHPPITFKQWLEMIHPEDRAGVAAKTEQAITAGGEFSYEFRVCWPDRSVHWILARGAAVCDEHRKPIRLIGLNVDITGVKSAEEALAAANEQLQHFAFTAGHDLQAPLRTVAVFAELLERTLGSSGDAKVQEALTHVRAGARRMHVLVDDLLAYARTTEPAHMAVQRFPLQLALEQAIENLAFDIRNSNAVITWDALPVVDVPGFQLAQVFQNLLGNAIKYARPTIAPAIHVSSRRRAQDWLISVQDNGMGFSMSYAASIFEPFKRLQGSQVVGTGLGLAICKRVIERCGGQIWSESEAGSGSTFFFTLPCAEPARVEPESPQASAGKTDDCNARPAQN